MPTLGIDLDFLWEFGSLQRQVREKVAAVFGEFKQATHTGLHLEKISGVRDPRLRSIRIDQFWRGIVLAPESGETYTLLRVLPHDDAYAWARRQRASVNRATGTIELRDVVAVEQELPALVAHRESSKPLLAAVSDADLTRLGIDEEILKFARSVTDPIQIDQAKGALPEAQYDVLAGLAAGYSPEEVWAELAAAGGTPGGYDPDDLDAALARSGRRIVPVSGPDELMAMFARPFALWRVFLHPAQRRAAYASYRGPARVTGGPGTGKTVAALHRALHLARQSPAPRSVLLTAEHGGRPSSPSRRPALHPRFSRRSGAPSSSPRTSTTRSATSARRGLAGDVRSPPHSAGRSGPRCACSPNGCAGSAAGPTRRSAPRPRGYWRHAPNVLIAT